MKKKNSFYNNYFKNISELLTSDENNISKLILIEKKLKKKGKNSRVFVFGNGGSASIASHFANDLSNSSKFICQNFSDSTLLTCFANDFGYSNWVRQVLKKNLTKDDIVFFISSSGQSKNMILGCKYAMKKGALSITLTGFDKNNILKKNGNINIWVNSKNYNFVENIHQIYLLSIADSLKKK